MILAFVCLPQAFAEPEVLVQEIRYPVNGSTVAQIRQSLDQHSPVRQNGQSFDAYTQWDILSRYALMDDRYDADTNYGARDGVRFP